MSDHVKERAAAVIVPVFNRPQLLQQTVAALKSQTLENAEFILIDDRSDQPVWDYLQSLPALDSRFRIIRKPADVPRGCQTSRNLGLDACRAETVMFLDSDDLLSPNCLEERYEFLVDGNADMVVGRQVVFSEIDGSVRWVNVPKAARDDLDRFLCLTHPLDVPWVNGAALIRKASLDSAGIRYRPEFEWEDVAFHFECLISGLRIVKMPFPGPADSFYRKHAGVRMGQDLFEPEGMRSAASMIRWMCECLRGKEQLTEPRRRTLAASLFQTCILRSIDADDFQLAHDLTAANAGGLPFSPADERRIRTYRMGRRTFRTFQRIRYYWDRFSRRALISEMFPSGPSTYGTVSPGTPEIYAALNRLLQPSA